jgi:hypothetical protein
MPDTETFRERYVLEHGEDRVRSSLGKSIIDLHAEFAAWKAVLEPAIRAAQNDHSKIFHQDEELAAIIAQCEHQKGDSTRYGPVEDPADDWLRNMPLEEQIGVAEGATNAVATAEDGMRAWKSITADARGVTPRLVLHSMTVSGGRPINLGWAVPNRFSTLGTDQDEAGPSKVANNA